MKREIKFKYLYTNGKNWITKVFTLEEIVSGDPCEVLSDNPLLKNYKHVGQVEWTGLKDKDGKEVYEGDVDKTGDVMMWSNRLALFCLHFYIKHDKRWVESSYPVDYHRLKVIGTMYENPELINQ